MAVLAGCGSDQIVGVGPGVTIFERGDFRGDGRVLVSDVSDLKDLSGPCGGEWDECISSILLEPGWTAILYERDGFEGDALPVLSDIADLDAIPGCGIGDWDNCAKSIRVMPPGS
jgi:hypothetical protein